MSNSKHIYKYRCIVVITSVILFLLIITIFLLFNISNIKNNHLYNKLKLLKDDKISDDINAVNNINTVDDIDNIDDNLMYGGLKELYKLNSDMVGWIKIEGTTIDYPVMQSEVKDYYLNHNFYKEYSVYGVPYIPNECSISEDNRSDNVIIYGHHIKGGRMFSVLDKYKNESFYKKHKYIEFDTLYSKENYEIIYVFKTTVYNESGFKYYSFINASSEIEFDEFINRCNKLSLYECSATAEYGDKFITLSTCEYSQQNGRLVVLAKKK